MQRHVRRIESQGVARALVACACLYPAAAPLHAQERATFPAADDGVVSADVYGSGVRGVILAPGGRFEKSSWAAQARVLAEAGFRVLALDLRGRGESRAGRAGPDSLHLDVLGAVRYLREQGVESVAAVGASLGGWAVAEAALAAEPGAIDRFVLLAHSAVDRPERLEGRKLFILSRDDARGGGVRRLPEIEEQYERAPEPKELVVLDGSAHAQLLFDTDQAERLMREILRFLSAP